MAKQEDFLVHNYQVMHNYRNTDYVVELIEHGKGKASFRIYTGFFANNNEQGVYTCTKTYDVSNEAFSEIMKMEEELRQFPKNVDHSFISGNEVLDILCGKGLSLVTIPENEYATRHLLFRIPGSTTSLEDVRIVRNYAQASGTFMSGYRTRIFNVGIKRISNNEIDRLDPEKEEICEISCLGNKKSGGEYFSLGVKDRNQTTPEKKYVLMRPNYNDDYIAYDEYFSSLQNNDGVISFTKVIEDDGEMSFTVTGNVLYRGYENLKLEIKVRPTINGVRPLQCLPFFDDNNITWDNDQFRLLLQKGNRAISYTGTSKNGNLDSSLEINISRSLSVKDYFDTRRKCLKLEKVRETVKREKERLKRLLKYVTPQKGASNLNVRYHAEGSNLFIGDFNTADYKGNNFLLVKNENGGLTVSDQAINPIGEYQLLDSGDVIVKQADDTYVVLNEDASKTKAKGRLQRDGSIDITIIGENEYNYQFTGTLSCLKGTIETAGSIGHCSLSVSNVKTPDALLSTLQQTVISWRGTPALEGKRLIYRKKQTKDLEQ